MSFASTFFGYVLEGLLVGHAEEEDDDDDDDDVDVVFSTLYLPIQLGETSIGALGIRFVQYLLFKNQKDATCLDGSFKIIFPRSFFFFFGGVGLQEIEGAKNLPMGTTRLKGSWWYRLALAYEGFDL